MTILEQIAELQSKYEADDLDTESSIWEGLAQVLTQVAADEEWEAATALCKKLIQGTYYSNAAGRSGLITGVLLALNPYVQRTRGKPCGEGVGTTYTLYKC